MMTLSFGAGSDIFLAGTVGMIKDSYSTALSIIFAFILSVYLKTIF
jgi:hypothetical protein